MISFVVNVRGGLLAAFVLVSILFTQTYLRVLLAFGAPRFGVFPGGKADRGKDSQKSTYFGLKPLLPKLSGTFAYLLIYMAIFMLTVSEECE